MIVKDEESYLQKCLEAARPFVDEIIIVDTGSKDKTKEIAKRYDARIFDFAWVDDFSEARNFSLSKATSDWILVLDADEIVRPADLRRMIDLISMKDYDASTLRAINYTNDKLQYGFHRLMEQKPEYHGFLGYIPHNAVRLFKNKKKVSYQNPVHESVDASI